MQRMEPGWRRAFRLPLGRRQVERELDDELAFHIAMKEEKLRAAGVPAADARAMAERTFGNVRTIRDECLRIDAGHLTQERWTMILEDFRHDAVVALRALARVPAFAAAAVATLALGIGATAAIFSVAYGVLLRPLPFPEPDRLVQPYARMSVSSEAPGFFSPPEFLDVQREVKSLGTVAAFTTGEVVITGDGKPERLRSMSATADLFAVLRARAVLGRTFGRDDAVPGGAPVTVLSHALWQRRFGGDPGIVGQKIVLMGTPVPVIGVLERGIEMERAELYLPMAFDPARMRPRGSHYLRAIGRLAPGATLERLNAELEALATRSAAAHPDLYKDTNFGMMALGLRESWVGDMRPTILVLAGAVGLLLLLACVNVANLLLVRAEARQREVAVRVALGAGRSRLVRQLLTETLILALLGALVGLPLAAFGVKALLALNPDVVPAGVEVGVDRAVLLGAAVVVLLAAVLAGLAPALHAGGLDVRGAIGTGATGGGRRGGRLRSALVAAEIAVATLVLVSAALVGRSFWQLMRVDPGFARENVLTFDMSLPSTRVPETPRVTQVYADMISRLEALPGVRRAALTSHLPLTDATSDWAVEIEGRDRSDVRMVLSPDFRVVSEGFFETTGIPLRSGRAFEDADTETGPFSIVVSEAFARHYWGNESPIGRRVRPGGSGQGGAPEFAWSTIVGVVGDVRHSSLDAEPRPTYYLLDRQAGAMLGFPFRGMSVLMRTSGDPRPVLAAVPRTVWSIDPELAVARLRPLDDVVAKSVARERFATGVLVAFGAVALLLAVTGVYGVLAYSVERRRREMGIRMALGARAAQVTRSVVGDGVKLVAGGLAVGLVLAFAATRLVASLLYEVKPADPLSFAGVAVLLALAALAASWLPARKATRVSPLEALRE